MRILLISILIVSINTFTFCQKNPTFLGLLSASPLIDFPLSDEDCSGFFFRDSSKIFLVTARHNLFDFDETQEIYKLKFKKFKLTYYKVIADSSILKQELDINLKLLKKINKVHFLKNKDIAAIEIGTTNTNHDKWIPYNNIVIDKLLYNPSKGTLTIFQVKDIANYNSITEGNDIYLIGYPRSLGLDVYPQYDINRPLVRKGIVAGLSTPNQTIIIDAATFDGNSGGPVLQVNKGKMHIIGLIIQEIPVSPNGRYVGNSGYSVVEPISSLNELLEKFN